MRKSGARRNEWFGGGHQFEHWYRDNSVFFITARCREGYPAFASERAKEVFWDRFQHYTRVHEFNPWVG